MKHLFQLTQAQEEALAVQRNYPPELIAAAPDLLKTLRWIRDNCTGLPAVARALAEKAITKAETQ